MSSTCQYLDRAGHALGVAVGVEADVLAVDVEADVVRLVHVRRGRRTAAPKQRFAAARSVTG